MSTSRLATGLAFGAALIASLAGRAPAAHAADQAFALHTVHGMALYGEPKYGPDFTHFDYADPDAPKGGTVRFAGGGTLSAAGSYDSFNPFSPRGVSAVSILNLTLLYDRLMEPSFDERQSQYGLLAESVTYPDDYAWAEYTLRENARWQDGAPITPEDVVFTFNIMREKGSPAFSYSVQDVASAEVTGPRTVKFAFKEGGNRRALFALGLLAVVPKHYWEGRDFSAPATEPPLASGPYRVANFEIGRTVTLQRDPNYWGKDVPLNVGRFNYGAIIYDYYRDPTVAFEGFKVGQSDVRFESSQKMWHTGYDWPAMKKGLVIQDTIRLQSGFQHQAFYFNTRREAFKDPVLREALGYAFDFAWLNKNLFYGEYERTESYFGFAGSDLDFQGLPSASELALLEPLRGEIPARVFTEDFHPPSTEGTAEGQRANLRIAAKLLADAGYTMQGRKLISLVTKQPIEFEILMADPGYELAANHWAETMKLLGVTASLRTVDLSQFLERQRKFDYDVIVTFRPAPPLPGPELRNAFSSAYADQQGSFALVGIKSLAIDALIEAVVSARTNEELFAATHALDRVLCWGFYSVPLYSTGGRINVAYWDRLGRPNPEAPFGWPWLNTWWVDDAKDAALEAARHAN